LINDLLYYSRLGRVQEKYENTDLNMVVDEALETLEIGIRGG
jgi:light-regulated signal transduction histidine kinase (bacteriophytochrome)